MGSWRVVGWPGKQLEWRLESVLGLGGMVKAGGSRVGARGWSGVGWGQEVKGELWWSGFGVKKLTLE